MILIIVSLVITLLCAPTAVSTPAVSRSFLGLPSPAEWLTDPTISFILAVALELCAMVGILLMVRAFNLMRGLRGGGLLMAGLFMMMQGASPSAERFSGGSLLAIVIITSVIALYSIYQRADGNQRIFLVFFLLGAGGLVQYGFIPFIPVMILGCFQMRVISLRAVVAILSGLLVPLWILWGFGVITFDTLTLPRFVNLFAPETFSNALIIAAATSAAILLGASTGLLDMVLIYARNAMTRARFGLMALIGLTAGILAIIDFGNILFYSTILNLSTAYFMTLLFSLRSRNQMGAGTVVIALSTLLFAALYIWKLTAALL